ncbi:hypothetical protein [Paenibacillus sp. B01]|uniref:hypothetical protein n=1 Tax=Paenibacillus sp. B01 TaxID=2660554 RepID=UPI00129ABB50|nr:hypothetical protein [Paenibacillus sp. B01]QGG54990.1 hypothetical protein GE073_04925 [Paenibacillus sp. B01]
MNEKIEIKILSHKFLSDDPTEPCSHGQLLIRINDRVISSEEDGDWVINEAALALMRTVKYGYPNSKVAPPVYFFEGISEDTLINCCGVYMLFCPSSIKWNVTLLDDDIKLSNFVKNELVLYPGDEVIVPAQEYAIVIYNFAIETYKFFEGRRNIKSEWEQFEGQIESFWNEYEELMKYIEGNFVV